MVIYFFDEHCFSNFMLFCYLKRREGSQVGVVVISRASHLYDPGSSPKLRTWAEICRSQSDLKDFSSGILVFLPLQIRLSHQELSCRAIKDKPLARKNGQPLPLQLALNKVYIYLIYANDKRRRSYFDVSCKYRNYKFGRCKAS